MEIATVIIVASATGTYAYHATIALNDDKKKQNKPNSSEPRKKPTNK